MRVVVKLSYFFVVLLFLFCFVFFRNIQFSSLKQRHCERTRLIET